MADRPRSTIVAVIAAHGQRRCKRTPARITAATNTQGHAEQQLSYIGHNGTMKQPMNCQMYC